jgi:hypothetical protein
MDVMDGKPLRYRLNPDGTLLLYSVGEDGVDDGGDPTPGKSWTDSKCWWLARDAVWPMPATPEEVKEYQDKIIAERKSAEARDRSMRSFGRSSSLSNVKTN